MRVKMTDPPYFDDYFHDYFNTSLIHHINWTFVMRNHTYGNDQSQPPPHNNIRDILIALGVTTYYFLNTFV
ncbi:hypothetical protein KUTeg_022558 [Tegillarca granosa]|uniref:Uncharacterized protein n=1 Tax=Tegillarca granosa TaxID=220873 RepID=A0ABQ9E6L7_TEGGR|nr:hypothetical protein KUTeg_022558 [Tegillarca granosa]